MADLTPERRALIRRALDTDPDPLVSLDAPDVRDLLDMAAEADRLLTVADTLGRVNGEYAMEIQRADS